MNQMFIVAGSGCIHKTYAMMSGTHLYHVYNPFVLQIANAHANQWQFLAIGQRYKRYIHNISCTIGRTNEQETH
jgi:hypothetical protein